MATKDLLKYAQMLEIMGWNAREIFSFAADSRVAAGTHVETFKPMVFDELNKLVTGHNNAAADDLAKLREGCACATTNDGLGGWWLGLLLATALRRRRGERCIS